jgi:hypothetical protein
MIKNIKTEQKLEYREYQAIFENKDLQMIVCIDGVWSKDTLTQMYSFQVFTQGYKTNFYNINFDKPFWVQMNSICPNWERIV